MILESFSSCISRLRYLRERRMNLGTFDPISFSKSDSTKLWYHLGWLHGRHLNTTSNACSTSLRLLSIYSVLYDVVILVLYPITFLNLPRTTYRLRKAKKFPVTRTHYLKQVKAQSLYSPWVFQLKPPILCINLQIYSLLLRLLVCYSLLSTLNRAEISAWNSSLSELI